MLDTKSRAHKWKKIINWTTSKQKPLLHEAPWERAEKPKYRLGENICRLQKGQHGDSINNSMLNSKTNTQSKNKMEKTFH
jgi:hypothetical protein